MIGHPGVAAETDVDAVDEEARDCGCRVVVCQAAGLETSLQDSVWAPASTRTKSTGGVFMKMPPSALPADCGLDHNVEFTDERIDYLGL